MPRLDLALAHALLGDQQHPGPHDQDSTEDVEDGGAHAAGGGKEGTGAVGNLSGNRKLRSICGTTRYFNFLGTSQLIVTGGGLGFYQIVGAVGKTLKEGFAVFTGFHGSGFSNGVNPGDSLGGVVLLVILGNFTTRPGYFLVQDKFCIRQLDGFFLASLKLVDDDLGGVDLLFLGLGVFGFTRGRIIAVGQLCLVSGNYCNCFLVDGSGICLLYTSPSPRDS